MSTKADSNLGTTGSKHTSLSTLAHSFGKGKPSSIGGGYRCYTVECDLYSGFKQVDRQDGLFLTLDGQSATASLVLAVDAKEGIVVEASSIIIGDDTQRQIFPFSQFRPSRMRHCPKYSKGCLTGNLLCTVDGIMGDKDLAFVWPVGLGPKDGAEWSVNYE